MKQKVYIKFGKDGKVLILFHSNNVLVHREIMYKKLYNKIKYNF